MNNPIEFFEFITFSCILKWGLGMVWDSKSSHMEEPNVDERDWAMGFHISTTTMFGQSFKGSLQVNFEGGHRLGLLHMDIQFMFGRIKTFCPLIPTHPPFRFCCYNPHMGHLCWCKGGVSLTIMGSLKVLKRIFWYSRKGVGDVGVLGNFGTHPCFA